MDFPHINDDKFPHINTVDVWKFQNDFDYARWQGKVSIKLLNVLWNSNYADVPGFTNDTARDVWFDKQDGLIHTLESAFNITPENSIRIPVPYNDAYRFNYLMVDMPIQTSSSNPIDYELQNTRVKRWYYFIDSMSQYAPNTTELFLTLDVWTTFSHTVEIPYLMLERGHAPLIESDVDSYLANPIENNEYLLAEDFNYGNTTIVSESKYFAVGNGRKYVLFAVPITQANFSVLGGAALSGDSTPPSYANEMSEGVMTRWGYQLIVNDYEWKYDDVSYASATLPIESFVNEDSVFNGNLVFAIASESASAFFNNLASTCVHLLHAIQGVFVVSEDMISLAETPFVFHDFTLYSVNKQYVTSSLDLSKGDFGFPSKYSELAKLYTYPYSVLEVTDDNGFKSEVRIENTGDIEFHKEISIAFPFVRYQCFFTGLNGNGTQTYTWKNLANQDVTKTMWEDDFSSFMMNWDIPTYGIFVSAEDEYAVDNYASMQAKRQGAIVDYENATRFANTNYQNTADSFQTNTDNVSAEMTAMVSNVAADMQTLVDNTVTACYNAEINVDAQQLQMENVKDAQNSKITSDKAIANGVTRQATATQNEYAAVAYGNTGGAQLAGATIGAFGSMVSDHPIQGGVSGLVNVAQTGLSVNAVGANVIAAIGTDNQLATLAQQANDAYAQQATSYNSVTTQQGQILIESIRINNKNCVTEQNDRTAATNNADAGRTSAARNANAARTQGTETNNADWTREAGIAAAKNNLEQAQREVAAQYANNRLGKPVIETEYSGDAYPDVFERRGARMNVRTQSKAAIAQAGDAFLRYGYALHRVWDMSGGWHYGKHFTFWKAEDIWINEGSGLAGNAVNLIGDILMKGVTVWRNPNEIGKVSIYDNLY